PSSNPQAATNPGSVWAEAGPPKRNATSPSRTRHRGTSRRRSRSPPALRRGRQRRRHAPRFFTACSSRLSLIQCTQGWFVDKFGELRSSGRQVPETTKGENHWDCPQGLRGEIPWGGEVPRVIAPFGDP